MVFNQYSRGLRAGLSRCLIRQAAFWGALGLSGLVCANEGASTTTPSTNDASTAVLEEITVTATHRSETIQNIPYNISSIGSAALAQAGATSINSLAQLVPGLQTVDTGANSRGGNNQFSMRGLRTDAPGNDTDSLKSGTVAPVSTYLGEAPIFFPLLLKDLERVEVLKGPQGTLYGSGALSGTIRFIPSALILTSSRVASAWRAAARRVLARRTATSTRSLTLLWRAI